MKPKKTEAIALRLRTDDWLAPLLWKSECRNPLGRRTREGLKLRV